MYLDAVSTGSAQSPSQRTRKLAGRVSDLPPPHPVIARTYLHPFTRSWGASTQSRTRLPTLAAHIPEPSAPGALVYRCPGLMDRVKVQQCGRLAGEQCIPSRDITHAQRPRFARHRTRGLHWQQQRSIPNEVSLRGAERSWWQSIPDGLPRVVSESWSLKASYCQVSRRQVFSLSVPRLLRPSTRKSPLRPSTRKSPSPSLDAKPGFPPPPLSAPRHANRLSFSLSVPRQHPYGRFILGIEEKTAFGKEESREGGQESCHRPAVLRKAVQRPAPSLLHPSHPQERGEH